MKMRKKISLWFGLGLMVVLAGCATTSGTQVGQSDIDALNARLSTLQAQLSEKDSEIAKLQNSMRDEEAARVQAEDEKRSLSQKLDSALSDLKSAKTPTKPVLNDSDLK
jgi:chromosome segregation ATPase